MLREEALKKASEDFIKNYSLEKNLLPATAKNKRNAMGRLLLFLQDQPFNLETARAYISHLYEKGLKPGSVKTEIKHLRSFNEFCVLREYLSKNFCKKLTNPIIRKTKRKLISQETALEVINAGIIIGKGDRKRSKFYKAETKAALIFMLKTGLRVGEAVALRGIDLLLHADPPEAYIRSKGGNLQTIQLPLDMVAELILRQKKKRVFEFTQETANDVLKRGCKRLGLPKDDWITAHSLRHIFATSAAKRGVPIEFTKEILRHSDIDVTERYYTHLDSHDLARVINSQPIVRKNLKEKNIDIHEIQKQLERIGYCPDGGFNVLFDKQEKEVSIKIKIISE